MPLADGYTDLPSGKLANVVTCLEMRARPSISDGSREGGFTLEWQPRPLAPERYRELFRKVGAEYLWTGRLRLSDVELRAIIDDPRVEVYALRNGGEDAGILELDFREPRECEIVLFGVTKQWIGTRAARWLMNRGLERAWAEDIDRVWLHTCTFDHPKALAFYRRTGFIPYKRQIEIHDDPRVLGLLPRECASNVPIL